jgi:hypothetical protein
VQPGAVRVQADIRPPQLVAGQSRATLAALPGRVSGHEGLGGQVAAVYGASLQARMAVRVSTAYAGCLVPDVLVLVTAPRSIRMAADLAPGTECHAAVLAHEQEHARIDDVLFRDLDGWLAAPLRRTLAQPRALRGSAETLNEQLRGAFNRAMAEFSTARRQAQLSIDTREEYLRVSRICRS